TRTYDRQRVTAADTTGDTGDELPERGDEEPDTATGGKRMLQVIQDRFRLGTAEPARVNEALEIALRQGNGHLSVHALFEDHEDEWRFSSGLHCARCDIAYTTPLPSTFSFNSPLGACEHCKGFGRVIGIDYGLVIPDGGRTLREGAIKPWQTASYKECQDDMERYAPQAGVRLDIAWDRLSTEEKDWVIAGTPDWKGGASAWKRQWYGVQRFFDWLESRAYRMHVRVLLSKYRSYTPCLHCKGARLKPDATLWRLGRGRSPIPGH